MIHSEFEWTTNCLYSRQERNWLSLFYGSQYPRSSITIITSSSWQQLIITRFPNMILNFLRSIFKKLKTEMIEILKIAPSFTETSSKRIKNFSLNLIFSDPSPLLLLPLKMAAGWLTKWRFQCLLNFGLFISFKYF